MFGLMKLRECGRTAGIRWADHFPEGVGSMGCL
jgi:hypothetical protein